MVGVLLVFGANIQVRHNLVHGGVNTIAGRKKAQTMDDLFAYKANARLVRHLHTGGTGPKLEPTGRESSQLRCGCAANSAAKKDWDIPHKHIVHNEPVRQAFDKDFVVVIIILKGWRIGRKNRARVVAALPFGHQALIPPLGKPHVRIYL